MTGNINTEVSNMSNLQGSPVWVDGIYQLTDETPVLGAQENVPGNGPSNVQAEQLANRTQYLKAFMESIADGKEYTFFKTASDPDGTLAGLQATENGKVFRVAQGDEGNSSFIYYYNNGIAVEISRLASDNAIREIASGYYTLNGKDVAEIVNGQVIYSDGSMESTPAWDAWYLKVESGETVTYDGTVGSNTVGEQMAYLIQLDENKSFVSSLAYWTSTGNSTDKAKLSGIATTNGFIYIRVRSGANFSLIYRKKTLLAKSDIDAAGGVASYASYQNILANQPLVDITSAQSITWVIGRVIYADGTRTDAAGESWRAVYVPVKKGDALEYHDEIGSTTPGELMAYIIQLDTSLNVVGNLATYTSTGVQKAGVLSGVAMQDGFAYIRVRVTTPEAVIYQSRERFTPGADVFGVSSDANVTSANSVTTDVTDAATTTYIIGRVIYADGSVVDNAGANWKALYIPVKAGDIVRYSGQIKAKVFNAPYNVDLSELPERNPGFDSFSNPLGYTFTKQWARRDFYNAADSLMLSFMDLENNPWNLQSNIYDITAGNVFSYSWSAGKVSFRNPTANGRVVMFADRYMPFATSEIAIDRLAENATTGIMFADVDQQNSVSVRVSNSLVICEIYAAGSQLDTTTFTGSDMTGAVLQVQNTGVSLLLKKVNADGTWKWIGRYEHYAIFDARKLEYLDTWKTYVFAQTDAYSASDVAIFSGFSNRIASGANSVSIRFLTYEDGTFIQRGNWLYFLVEGTGTTISDLYTQIVRINFKSSEVQMIGAIFQVRTDGTDEDVVLGDDSIKAVYDRNSQSWKGISCGMDYQGKGLADNNRPKLYFETKQDLLQGGVIIVRNSVQLKNANGSFFGIGSSYVEDIDFYYEASSSQWVMTGNTISSGCKTFRSPTLYDGIVQEYTTAEVPAGVRDTGNQFVHFGETIYLTSGGTANRLHLRKYEAGLTFLGAFVQDVYLAPNTTGPWCTLVPFTNGDETELFMLSFDRSNLYEGLGNGAATYDHGGLYCWKANRTPA